MIAHLKVCPPFPPLPQVEALQFDFLDRDSNAFPETVEGVLESHGTEVAGQVAMEKGNDVCGVGVAYNSFITGLCVYYTRGGHSHRPCTSTSRDWGQDS